MPLDKVIVSHLDEMDKIEDKIDDLVEKLVVGMSIDELMRTPETALGAVIESVKSFLVEEYYQDAVDNGFKLAKTIEDDGDIKIVDSTDPKENA